ncbi:hypothetical protein C6P76_13890 [Burkholderia multivorans]|uniref:hypothetical protein n=1 Tax=Burkholderia multivorans TaxID=87883 RepID=UPI000D0007FF|nr:hypothetical protein [Burkholderia multivorans]PRD86905.1 hypothetical protein C6P76_13890 [Burkholderia multivorans]
MGARCSALSAAAASGGASAITSIRDITEHGYDDPGRLQEWLRRLRFAAMADLPTDAEMRNRMQTAMDAVSRHGPMR